MGTKSIGWRQGREGRGKAASDQALFGDVGLEELRGGNSANYNSRLQTTLRTRQGQNESLMIHNSRTHYAYKHTLSHLLPIPLSVAYFRRLHHAP